MSLALIYEFEESSKNLIALTIDTQEIRLGEQKPVFPVKIVNIQAPSL